MSSFSNQAFQKQLASGLGGLGLWSLLVVFSATRMSGLGSVTPWSESFRIAATQWLVWAFAAVFIAAFDNGLTRFRPILLQRLLLHIPLSFIVPCLTTYVSELFVQPLAATMAHLPSLVSVVRNNWGYAFYNHVIIYWAILGVYNAYAYYQRLNERQLRTAELERLVSESRLQALRSQLQPHFLFNTLNAISAHLERDPRLARRMLEQLGTLLRLSLEHSNDQEIPLQQELTFLKSYLDLQQVRYADRLQTSISVDDRVLKALVPTFILQPFIENAIQYGIAPQSKKGTIAVAAWEAEGKLYLRVEDDGAGLPASWDSALNVGVGISNSRERLRWLYGAEEQQLKVSEGSNRRGVRVDLVLPYHQ